MAEYHYSMTVSDGNYNIQCTELAEGYTGSVGNLTCKYTSTDVRLTDRAYRNWMPILDAPASNIEVTDTEAGYDEDVLTLSDLITYFTTVLHIPESGEGGGGGESVEWGDITGDIDDNADLANALQGKQDTLTAGTGISINNNVISATGGGGGSQVQADWNQSNSSAVDYIKNKPTLRQPASDGTAGQYLKSAGSGNAPVWETMDTTPTESSAKAITSGAVYTALSGKADASTVRFVIHAEYNVGTGAITLASATTQASLLSALTAKKAMDIDFSISGTYYRSPMLSFYEDGTGGYEVRFRNEALGADVVLTANTTNSTYSFGTESINWVGTQGQYDAITTKDPNRIYYITASNS